MKVTNIILTFPNKPGPKFKCWAKIVLDDLLLVNGIRLFETKTNGNTSRFIRFPDRQPPLYSTGGERISIAVVNTNNEELRQHITDMVFDAYDSHPNNPANFKHSHTTTSNNSDYDTDE